MGDAPKVYLFSYGTLRQADVQLASFGRLLQGSEDAMPGYAMSMVEITDPDVIEKSGSNFHPIVRPAANPDDEVQGMVFTITGAELVAADRYEVSDYRRIAVRLKSGLEAWVYVASNP